MTTITYRDGVLAADSRSSGSGFIYSDSGQKFWKLPDGRLAAGSGELAEVETFVRWLSGGAKKERPKLPNSRVVVAEKSGIRHVFEGDGDFTDRSKFSAWGSGAPAALGAMHMGADAIQAVEIASKIDPFTGGRVRSGTLPGFPRRER